MQRVTLSAMVEACGERIVDANKWAEHNCNSDEWNKRQHTKQDVGRSVKVKREELIEWILTYSPDIAARLPKRSAAWSVTSMTAVCGDQIYTANQWARSMCQSQVVWDKRRNTTKKVGPDIKIRKDELTDWILKVGPGDIFEKLSEGICFVDIGLENRLELYEFFHDCFYREDYELTLDTHENDPRFVSQ